MPTLLPLIGVIAALAYLPLSGGRASLAKSLIKTVPLTAFAAFAYLSGAPVLLMAGLALSALGDLALSRDGEPAFLAGLSSFAAGHLAYIALFVTQDGGIPPNWMLPLAFVVLGVSTEFWLIPHVGKLRTPVRVYVILITLMGITAQSMAVPAGRLGAILFVASDLVLSIQLFRLSKKSVLRRPAGWLLWTLYIGGQGLLLHGFVPLSLP